MLLNDLEINGYTKRIGFDVRITATIACINSTFHIPEFEFGKRDGVNGLQVYRGITENTIVPGFGKIITQFKCF